MALVSSSSSASPETQSRTRIRSLWCRAQPLGVFVGMTRPPGEHELYRCVYLFIGLDQQIAVLLRRKASQKEDVPAGFETPFAQPPGVAPLAQRGAVRYICGFGAITRAVIVLQGPRHNHGQVGQFDGRPFSQAENGGGDAVRGKRNGVAGARA